MHLTVRSPYFPALLIALSMAACSSDPAAPVAETPAVRGSARRGNVALSFGQVRRCVAAGEPRCTSTLSSETGFFFFEGLPAPYDLRFFDPSEPSVARSVTSLIGLRTPKPSVQLSDSVSATSTWAAPIAVRLEDDANVLAALANVSTDRVKTLVLVSGPKVARSEVSLTAGPRPSESAQVALAWEGPYQSFARVHVLRFEATTPPRFLGYGASDTFLYGNRDVVVRVEVHPAESQPASMAVSAPEGFVTSLSVGLDFGEGGSVGSLADGLSANALLTFPRVDGVRAVIRGHATKDGARSSVAPPPVPMPTNDPITLTFATPPTLSEPAADDTVDGSQPLDRTRFAWAIRPERGEPSWVHRLVLTPENQDATSPRVVLVTHETSGTLPSLEDLGARFADGGASPLPPLAGAYRWSVESYPDLRNVDETVADDFNPRGRRTTSSAPRKLEFR